MSANYSYDKLPIVHETSHDQDITEASHDESYNPQSLLRPLDSQLTLRPLSFSDYSPTQNSPSEKDDSINLTSRKSWGTIGSTSSGSSTSKLKSLGARIRRKPLPRYLRGSIKRHPAAEIEPARVGRGVWRDQLLSDRSLRGMAALMSAFAIGMIVVVACYARYFAQRSNRNTSSVGGDTQSCKAVTRTNTALLLLINVCATMVLGMSNTYQQLVTSLKICDLKHALSKFGDSRVGTNSPFSIKHKKEGKTGAWAAWCLLIMTSLPVHFLANSLIGPSYTQELPQQINFAPAYTVPETNSNYTISFSSTYAGNNEKVSDDMSFPCWSAFRTGKAHYAKSTAVLSNSAGTFSASQKRFYATWNRMEVHYIRNKCEQYRNDTGNSDDELDTLERSYTVSSYYNWQYGAGDCKMGTDVFCVLDDPGEAKCRLNVRMSAAFTLMACLVIKATYMCVVNLLNRGKLKEHCLTFGDVIVASASHPELRVQGECMVNSTDNFRRNYSHTCHKHCFNPQGSKTGDEIGHCQKCKKWNSNDKFAQLPQPAIATKIKKSLISNLGNTALTQMLLLMFCGLTMLGVSLFMAVLMGAQAAYQKRACSDFDRTIDCQKSDMQRFDEISGGFGGFNRSLQLYSLPPDNLANEFISFSVSNGAQFIYSLLYLMLIYNITLISQEHDWGKLEYSRRKLRSTLVSGPSFSEDYLLQLPKKILFPTMGYSVLTHWMLGEALQTQEAIWLEPARHIEHSKYIITYAAYPTWIATFLILLMTGVCWWAFTYKREGFVPQMFGSIRVLMAATSQLDDFPENGLQWGDLGEGGKFRHAGLSAEEVGMIVPNELYAGMGGEDGDCVGGNGRAEYGFGRGDGKYGHER